MSTPPANSPLLRKGYVIPSHFQKSEVMAVVTGCAVTSCDSLPVAAGGDYRHEMDTSQHEALANSLSLLKGAVILSGYPSDLYERLYAGWRRVEKRDLSLMEPRKGQRFFG